MKILYIITKSNWGGAQKYVYDLATHMRSEGNEVVVAYGGEGKFAEKLKEANIRTIQIKNLARDINIFKEFSVARELYKIIRQERPDIVHLNSSKIGALGSLVARLAGVPKIIFTAHGFAFREERSLIETLLIKFVSWLTIIFSTKVICVSEKDYKDVENWLWTKKKLVMIHNGIQATSQKPSASASLRRDKQNEIVRIVSIGELHRNKGFEYALETMSNLKNRISNFHYIIYSFGGEERARLERMILELGLSKHVELIISEENHQEHLAESDIYFLPSVKEGLPYVLLEASLASLPIVASETGGVGEILENYQSGFLLPVKDVNGFVLALEKLILDEKLRDEFGRKLKKHITREFNLDKMLKATSKLYF